MGKTPQQASIDGTKEVMVAVLAADGTHLVVFTPIAFMAGIVGQFMKEFGLTVVFATLFSMLASFTLTPMFCSIFLKQKDEKAERRKAFILIRWVHQLMDLLLLEYKRLFDFQFKYPKITIVIALAMFLGSFKLIPYIGNEFMPSFDQDVITVSVVLPQGGTIEKTASVMSQVEALVKDLPEAESVLTSIGDNGVENALVIVNLKASKTRKRSDIDIINELIPIAAKIPDADINFKRGNTRMGMDGDVSIQLEGSDYERLIHQSQQALNIMEKSGYFRSVKSSYVSPKNEIRFIPDENKMSFMAFIMPLWG
jgi:HAE1 family hydrophobic/amphiphilic exporter-1